MDYLIIAILVLIIGGAALYVYRAKKRGVKCIGCPDGKTCSGSCGSIWPILFIGSMRPKTAGCRVGRGQSCLWAAGRCGTAGCMPVGC